MLSKKPEANPLPTLSGRIDIASEVINSFGYVYCPGYPTWLEAREWLGKAMNENPLHSISGQPETRLHGQFDARSSSWEQKVKDLEALLINLQEAAPRIILDGDVVIAKNEVGRCLAGARITDDVRPGVVSLWTGATFDPDLSNANHL